MSDDEQLLIENIKQEPETRAENDLDIVERCSVDESSRIVVDRNEDVSLEIEAADMKSDDDMQGYDTRSEVASSVASDSDSADALSSKSFDTKRKRNVKTFSESNRKSILSSPLKRNSHEYIGKLNYLFRDARFFIIKSSNVENITLAKTKGVWATLPQNQIRLSEAFRNCRNVLLIFSAKESGKFSGFARVATGVDRSISPVPWIVPSELTPNLLKGTFRIDWICRKDLPFSFTTSLYNPWNNNKPVKIARDGQEVEPRVGEKLCQLFPEDKSVDMSLILQKSKETRKNDPKNVSVPGALYTAKYRARMTQRRDLNERKTFPHGIHDPLGRVSKHHYKRFPPPTQMMASMESYVKRFGHGFRPPVPMPVPLPFLPPPLPGSEIFSQQFRHVPFPPSKTVSSSLARYYDPPIPSSFRHFSRMNSLRSAKNVNDRSVGEYLKKTREKEYYDKKNKERRKESENRSKKPSFYRNKH